VLDWLGAHVTEARAPRSFFLVRLLPPRPSFIADMSDAERKFMGDHVTYWRKMLGAWGVSSRSPAARKP